MYCAKEDMMRRQEEYVGRKVENGSTARVDEGEREGPKKRCMNSGT